MDPAAHVEQARGMAADLLVDTIRIHRPQAQAAGGRYSSPGVVYVPDADTVAAAVQVQDSRSYSEHVQPGADDITAPAYVVKTDVAAPLEVGFRVEVVASQLTPELAGTMLHVTRASRQTFGVLLRALSTTTVPAQARP